MRSLIVSGWVMLILGPLVIALGGILSTLSWKAMDSRKRLRDVIRGKDKEAEVVGSKNKRHFTWAIILLCATLIAAGSHITTYGWKKLDTAGRLRATIRAIGLECVYNQRVLQQPLLTSKDTKFLEEPNLYIRLISSATEEAIASGLFDPSLSEDKETFRHLAIYQTAIVGVNGRFDIVERVSFTEKDVASLRIKFKDSSPIKMLDEFNQGLMKHLREKYGWIPYDLSWYFTYQEKAAAADIASAEETKP